MLNTEYQLGALDTLVRRRSLYYNDLDEIIKPLKIDINSINDIWETYFTNIIKNNNVGLFRTLLNRKEINIPNVNFNNSLLKLTFQHYTPRFAYILKKYEQFDINNFKDISIVKLIQLIISSYNIGVLQFILSCKIDNRSETLSKCLSFGVHSCIKIKLLIDEVDIKYDTAAINAALMLSVRNHKYIESFKLLADFKDSDINCKDIHGISLLENAIYYNNFEAYNHLIKYKSLNATLNDSAHRKIQHIVQYYKVNL